MRFITVIDLAPSELAVVALKKPRPWLDAFVVAASSLCVSASAERNLEG